MNLSNCQYYCVVYSLDRRRCFRLPYNTLHGAKRCMIRYRSANYHVELHDRITGLVLESC